MINNTNLYDAFSNIERDLDSYIEVNGIKYGSKDLLKGLKVNIKADKDGIWIGRAIPKMLNAEIINNGIIINAGDEIKPYFGVKIGEVYQYINVGTFYAQNPEYTEDRKLIKIVAYDKLKVAQTLEYGAITYPITVAKVVDIIASKLEIAVDKTNLLFLDYNIEKEVYFGKDKTVIELINAIAQMSMTFAYLDYDNVLKFKRPNKVTKTLNDDNVFKFRFKDFQKQYNAVVISRQPQNDDVALKVDNNQSENIEMKLSNNPILDLNREFFITDLLNTTKVIPAYNGLENLTMQSNPLLEVGDIVTFRDKDVVILEHEITMTRSMLKSQIAEKTETDYKKSKGLEDLAINTELYVDKVKNEIVAKIGDEVGNKITELKLDEAGITQRVSTTVDNRLKDPTVIDTFKGTNGANFTWNIYKGGAILDKTNWAKYDAKGLTINDEEIFFHAAKKETTVMGVYKLNDYNDILESGKTYTVSFDVKNLRDDARCAFGIHGLDGTNIEYLAILEEKRVSFTGTRNANNNLHVQARNTALGFNLRFEMRNLKIEEGAVANTIFTPHPDEMKGRDGQDGVAGKDGVGIKHIEPLYAYSTSATPDFEINRLVYEEPNVMVRDFENQWVDLNGNFTPRTLHERTDYIKIKAGDTVNLFITEKGQASDNGFIRYGFYDVDKALISRAAIETKLINHKIVAPANAQYLVVSAPNNSNTTVNINGSPITKYYPHTSKYQEQEILWASYGVGRNLLENNKWVEVSLRNAVMIAENQTLRRKYIKVKIGNSIEVANIGIRGTMNKPLMFRNRVTNIGVETLNSLTNGLNGAGYTGVSPNETKEIKHIGVGRDVYDFIQIRHQALTANPDGLDRFLEFITYDDKLETPFYLDDNTVVETPYTISPADHEARKTEHLWQKFMIIYTDGTVKLTEPIYIEQGADGKDAYIPSTTPPTDTSRYWMDLNENKLKYFDKATNTWKDVNWQLEERIQTAERKVTDSAIIDKVTKSEQWITLSDTANNALDASEVQKKIDEFSTNELTSDKLMTKISNTTTWTDLNSKVNSKIDSKGVNTAIKGWADQTLTTSYFNTQLGKTTSFTDLSGKYTDVEKRTASLELNLKDFQLEFNKETDVNLNLIPRTEDFTKGTPEIIYGGDLYAGANGSLLRFYDPTNDSTDSGNNRWQINFNREIRLEGQTFWLSMSAKAMNSADTRVRYRLINGDGTWSDPELLGTQMGEYRYIRMKLVAPNSGTYCKGIYIQIYNTVGTATNSIEIQSKTLKCEIGKSYTPWTSAETDEIKGANYYFGLDGVKFIYNNEDVLKVDPTNGLYIKGNGEFTGKLTATSGVFRDSVKIGGFTISADRLVGNGITLDPRGTYAPVNVGPSYINTNGYGNFGSGSFSGGHSGTGTFSSGSYTGSVYSGGGTLGGTSYSNDSGLSFSGSIRVGGLSSNGTVIGATVSSPSFTSGVRNGSGQLVTATLRSGGWSISNSDIRLKENIEDLGHEFDNFIYDLPLIKYNYIGDEEKTPQVGVNANYLMKVLPEYMAKSFLHQDKNTGLYGAKYELLVPYLIKTIQDLNNRIKELEVG